MGTIVFMSAACGSWFLRRIASKNMLSEGYIQRPEREVWALVSLFASGPVLSSGCTARGMLETSRWWLKLGGALMEGESGDPLD